MSQTAPLKIDPEAAKALARWKAVFADEVCTNAKRLVSVSNCQDSISSPQDVVSLAHYREAARLALASLATLLQAESDADASRRVA